MAEIETGGFQDGLHAIEREVYLGRGLIWHLAAGGIAAGHGGKEQPVVGQNARRSGIVRFIARRIYGPLIGQTAHGDRINLNRWLGKPCDPEHSSGGRGLGEDLGEDLVHLPIPADVFEINVDVNHVLHGQPRGLDDGLDVFQSLPDLGFKGLR